MAEELALAEASAAAAPPPTAEVLLETHIDALDITVLRGGGDAVGDWAREHGFRLTPDAPEVLDFYAERSPIFLAARFDATAARDRGQAVGDGHARPRHHPDRRALGPAAHPRASGGQRDRAWSRPTSSC